MLYVQSDGTIRLTRGDTADLEVQLQNLDTKDEYSIKTTDKVTLSIKKSTKDDAPLVQKSVTGSNVINILPEDTSTLPFGKYKYDVQLETLDHQIYTVIEPSTFVIMEEVT